jgi:hypothetical protein
VELEETRAAGPKPCPSNVCFKEAEAHTQQRGAGSEEKVVLVCCALLLLGRASLLLAIAHTPRAGRGPRVVRATRHGSSSASRQVRAWHVMSRCRICSSDPPSYLHGTKTRRCSASCQWWT